MLQLLRRSEIERSSGELVCDLLNLENRCRELCALSLEHVAIDQNAGFFHRKEHRDQRLLDVFIKVFQRFVLAELAPYSFVQAQRNVGILGRIWRCQLQVDLVKRQLFGALACNVFKMNRLGVEVKARC